jgi:uracil-DNA glycosylase
VRWEWIWSCPYDDEGWRLWMEDQIGKVALQTTWEQKVAGCTRCRLHEGRQNIVYGIGNTEQPDFLFLGEGPGAHEDQKALPFVGQAGKLLDKILHHMGYTREDVYICNVVSCFTGGTVVEAPGVRGAYRREYDGELLRVRTTGGFLTGTPNHPALTSRGWVPLCDLAQGDDLVRCHFNQSVLASDPHVHDRPSKIKDLFDALSKTGVSERVVESDVDFHGDRGQSEVEIVTLQGLLTDRSQPSLLKHLFQFNLKAANDTFRLLKTLSSRYSTLPQFFGSAPLLATGGPCSACQFTPPLFGGSSEPQGHSLAPPSDVSPLLDQIPSKSSLPDPGLLGERLKTLSGDVAFDKVVEIEVSQFTGHVYNLHTASEWYTADGYIVSNCRPPGNRDPKPDELEACTPVWTSQVIAVRPKMIIALGRFSGNALLGTSGQTIVQMRKKIHAWNKTPVQVTYHPAGMLRNESYKQPAWDDLRKAMKHLEAMKAQAQDAGPLFGGES